MDRGSALPRPAGSPRRQQSKHLSELSESQNNARQPGSMAAPPPPLPGQPKKEVPAKRKTLQERGGEPFRPAPNPPGGQPGLKAPNSASIIPSLSSSSSATSTTRPSSSASSRNVSNSSWTSNGSNATRTPYHRSHASTSNVPTFSNGPGSRAPSVQGYYGRNGRKVPPVAEDPNSMTPFSSTTPRPRAGSYMREGRQSPVRHGISPRRTESDANLGGKRNSDITVISQTMQGMSIGDVLPLLPFPSHRYGNVSPGSPSAASVRKAHSCNAMRNGMSESPMKTPKRTSIGLGPFLTIDSNTRDVDWREQERLDREEAVMIEFRNAFQIAEKESTALKDSLQVYKARVAELEDTRDKLSSTISERDQDIRRLRDDLLDSQTRCNEVSHRLQLETSASKQAIDDLKRTFSIELDDLQRHNDQKNDRLAREREEEVRRLKRDHEDELDRMRRKYGAELEDEKGRRQKEVQALASQGFEVRQQNEHELQSKVKLIESLGGDLDQMRAEVFRERETVKELRSRLADTESSISSIESSKRSLQAKIDFLESDAMGQSCAFADLESKTQNALREAEESRAKLRTEETLRRKLHNQVQELKGNIRVFCRVRPPLDDESEPARMTYPDAELDAKELEVTGQEEKSSLGNVTTKKHPFSFDRIFGPTSQNAEVFDEISQLVQSALDGYNVCIFCYGQTGSGKTHTMSAADGMIPRAVNQIYDTALGLEEKGWKYSMEGSFVEVYNESINDLLGNAEDLDKKKHEIRHDEQRLRTTITDTASVPLDSPGSVEDVLRRAAANRSVAATKANERSSRSHSVFILRLAGSNAMTNEKSEGTLNLVDLAGSERLSHSEATGARLKETQNINKSLSCLGDVIGALGQGKKSNGHVPYRNSKLTHLLQYSLGGNSKTLMFVMVSPLQAHLNETLTSLKFALKVHNTHIGTAKKQTKVKE